MQENGTFLINGEHIRPGARRLIDLEVGSYTTHERVSIRAHVLCGQKPGPCLMVTGCVHGDEINGAEIIRRLVRSTQIKRLRGTLIAVPIVNIPAFLNRSRYLPDRRDLNRLFPGSATGSLGARLARVITEKLLPLCDAVIDLHTGAVNRHNLAQVRVTHGDPASLKLAEAFESPVTLLAQLRESSFRTACHQSGVPMILYESGEALRLDTPSIRFGLQGIISVMRSLHMLPAYKRRPDDPRASRKPHVTVMCRKSFWERAPKGGIFTPFVPLGKAVSTGSTLGFVADPYGEGEFPVIASRHGVIIGRTNEGLADEGDALFHIALTGDPQHAESQISRSSEALPELIGDEDDHPVPYDPITDTVS